MSAHTTTIKAIRRPAHDLARTVYLVRCNGCNLRAEYHDSERAGREALRHEASGVRL